MEHVKIYLAGGMSNLTLAEQTQWRMRFKDAIRFGDYDIGKKPIFFDPTKNYSIFEQEHKSEREVFEYDLYNLKRSDLVVVNFNSTNSIGTAMELAIAKENNIPVIGLNKENADLHPWILECCTRICGDFRELVEYVAKFFLE